jgi:hypothetical protein
MKLLLMIVLLFSGVGASAGEIKDGSIIVFDKGTLNRSIYKHTGSTKNHLAVVFNVDGKLWVYESTWPRVKRVPFKDYLRWIESRKRKKRKLVVTLVQPNTNYSPDEVKKMLAYANSQLGRKYMMRGWWKNREVRGIHCSQFVASVLKRSGKFKSNRPWKEAPGDVIRKIKKWHSAKKL